MTTRLSPERILQRQLEQLGVARPGDVGWSHGTNSRAKLAVALGDPKVQYVEGDISLGSDGQAIMAHPPADSSDLSFSEWLRAIAQAGKGAKLDFKSPVVVEACLEDARRTALGKIPMIVNADLLVGPGGGPANFDPTHFLSLWESYLPESILSPGWKVSETGTSYSREMLLEMYYLLRPVAGAVTLCFHAWFLFTSWPDVKWLLDQANFTVTVWGNVADPELLGWLRNYTNPERCFYDVQDALGNQIFVTQA